MHMPKVQRFNCIIVCRDDLSGVTEGRALHNASAKEVARFFWEQIICRYGAVYEVVTDNGSETKGAFELLVKKYGIHHIRISPYNSKANGVVERGHFILREALIRSCEGVVSCWPQLLPHALFADRITIRRATGFSPYYLLHGVHPVLPMDLREATFMVEGFRQNMSHSDLLTLRIRQLERRVEDIARAAKVLEQTRLHSKYQFEARFAHRLKQDSYKPGDLVLVRNTAIEKEMNRKSKPRYLGPFEIVRQTKYGSYVIKELNGDVSRESVAAFRLLRYHPRVEDLRNIETDPIELIGDRYGQVPENEPEQDLMDVLEYQEEEEDFDIGDSENDQSETESTNDVPISQRTRSQRRNNS